MRTNADARVPSYEPLLAGGMLHTQVKHCFLSRSSYLAQCEEHIHSLRTLKKNLLRGYGALFANTRSIDSSAVLRVRRMMS